MTHLIDDACCISCCVIATTVAVVKIIKYELYDSSSVRLNSEDTKRNFLLRSIEHYQREISPEIKRERGLEQMCRFSPSCSEYARQGILYHGPTKGVLLAMNRLARCNPFSAGGYDPVII